jgi:hypothetical protein
VAADAQRRRDRWPAARVLLAALAVGTVAAGLAVDAVIFAQHASRDAGDEPAHPLRNFLVAVDARMPAGATYAVTGARRSSTARYFLYPRVPTRIRFDRGDAAVRDALRRRDVRYVVVVGTPDDRRRFARPRTDWYRTVLRMGDKRLVEIVA